MTKYRKKTLIEAVQWTGDNDEEVEAFMGGECVWGTRSADVPTICIATLEGTLETTAGCWIAKGAAGEFYPIQDAIFRETYEEAES